MLPGAATAPAPSGARLALAAATGRRAVALAGEGPGPAEVLTRAAFRNALVVLAALGGSTNAVIHLLAIARRAGVPLELGDFHAAAAETPVLVDCKPVGAGFLEDLDRAGGLPVLLRVLRDRLDLSARTVAGATLRQVVDAAPDPPEWQRTVRVLGDPVAPPGGLVVLRGSLAPGGAVLKASAASEALLRHRGPAVVFESPADVADRIDDPALGITPEHVLVLRNAGPVAAGMPEAGWLPIPAYLGAAGVRDMVRVSDARMSGTAYGTTVLHCAPEAAVGGPIGLVRDGDLVELDARAGRLDLLVGEEELARRRSAFRPPPPPERGWRRLVAERVLGADQGADLDFL
jgi:dihydroxy-acid dehydratase